MKERLYILVLFTITTVCTHAQSWTQAELNSANTAANVSVLTQEEKNVIMYCNLARMYPRRYVEIELKEHTSTSYERSLVSTLNSMTPVGPLRHSDKMYPYAKCWAEESGRLGVTGHTRRTCANMPAPYGENCDYGYTDGRNIIRHLLIDENVPSLGHRVNCLNREYTEVGVFIASHSVYRYCCVMDFTYKMQQSSYSYNVSDYSYTSNNNSSSLSHGYSDSSSEMHNSSKKLANGDTPRDRFCSHAGVKHTSFVSVGYSYPIKKEVQIVNASLLDFRYKMFGASLINAEMGMNPWSKWIGYSPSIKVFFPMTFWFALSVNAGATADVSIVKSSVKESFDYDMKDDFFASANGGLSLYFVPTKYTPIELKAEYRHDICNESPIEGLVFGCVLHLGR